MNWTAITSLVTSITAVGALTFTALSLNSTRDQVAIAQQGQLTERYSRAVEQIGQQGPDHLQVRLGGIYALERLARDSPRDQPTIIEVLSAFVRTNSPPATALRKPLGSVSCGNQRIGPDVQAGLTVLGRRTPTADEGTRIDLHETCLTGAVFNRANLVKADLTGANLTNVSFFAVDISGALFVGADFTGARSYLISDDLNARDVCRGTEFRYANLARVGIGCRWLEGADFYKADLSGATIGSSYAPDAVFNEANLAGAVLTFMDLTRSKFVGANLTGASLTFSKLGGADLRETKHDGTEVSGLDTDSNTQGKWWS